MTPQLSLNGPVKQCDWFTKQQNNDVPVEHIPRPPAPPWVQMQPFCVLLQAVQQTCEGSEQPLKHSAELLPQLLPIVPLTKSPVLTQIVFFVYAPAFPGVPPPQQHICAPDPPAPHTSITALPVVGGFQQNPLQKFVYMVPGVNT
jgi:hypothetical protein